MSWDWNNFWRSSRGFLDSQIPGLSEFRNGGGGSGVTRTAQPSLMGGDNSMVMLVLVGVAAFMLMRR